MPRAFYRFVASDPPIARDFLSNCELGRPRRAHAGETEDEWRGLSVFDSVEAARAMVLRVPRFPLRLVARIEFPASAVARIEKTHGPGHYTAWADPGVFLDAVVSVVQIRA